MLLRRVAATLPVMAVVALLVFLLIHLAPGDPAALIAGDLASADDIARLHAALGLDQPLWRQFAIWAGHLAHGDLGTSIFTQVPVSELLAQRLEPTLSIAVVTMVIAVALAIPLGTLAAYRAGSWVDRATMLFAVLAFSVPVFLIGYLLIWGFAIQLQWLPVQGYVHLREGVGPWLAHLVLPCVNLALVYMALLTRMTRATVIEVLQEDYIRTARAKGLGVLAVLGHALRNAAIPIATTVGVRHRPADRRRRRHRDGVRDSRRRPAGDRLGAAARLSGDPERAAAVGRRLRAGQPADRSQLSAVRSAHPRSLRP